MKTALITGASRGIGAACAKALRNAGMRVVVNYNNSEAAALSLASELECRAMRADVSDPEQVHNMFAQVGGVDVLVCCAGLSLIKLLQDTSRADMEKIIGVNLMGTIYCCQAALPYMINRKSGSIITFSSIWGETGASCETVYSASKAGVIGFTKALAKELGPSGIRVNCVSPGVIDTDMNASLTDAVRNELCEETPLGRLGTSAEVAEVVRFLASDASGFITGQVLGVNGGFLI